jgi:hypothetical protein
MAVRPPPCSATPTNLTYIPDIDEGLTVLGEHPAPTMPLAPDGVVDE